MPLSTLELAFQAELKQNKLCLSDGSLFHYYLEKFKTDDFIEVSDLAKLLFLGGEYEKVLQLCSLVIEYRKPLTEDSFPWHYLVESVFRLEPFPPESLRNSIHALTEKLHVQELFATSPHARKFAAASENIFAQWINQAESAYDNLKKQYIDELRQAELEGSPDRENEIIQKLTRIDPTDAAIIRYGKKIRERRAMEILSQPRLYEAYQNLSDLDDAEVKKMFQLLIGQIEVKATEWPSMAMDFAVALIQWGEYQSAQHILELAPISEEKDWLLCELLLLQNKRVDLLSILPQIEVAYANESQTFFHSAYLRAKCYYGLGQKEMGIEILESLTTTQPDYRDANILLMQWRSE
ncbi:MAG: hypothetical protein ACK5WZ_01205 [Pseudobdellovibrionaceae bacterium]